MMVCDFCGVQFPTKAFINGKLRNLQRRKFCLSCSPFGGTGPKRGEADRSTRWRRILKLKAIDYKGGKCVQCGYKKCPAALSFHHSNPSEKESSISGMSSWNRMKPELDKCILLCHNCHQEEHHDRSYDQARVAYQHHMDRIENRGLTPQCRHCGGDFKPSKTDQWYCTQKCSQLASRRVIRPSKADLEKRVWSKPMTTLASELGVSDAAVRKWCVAYGIPWPGRGYWQKRAR